FAEDDGRITADSLALENATTKAEPKGTSLADPDEELSLEDYFTRFVLEKQDTMTETELAQKLGISRKSLWERRQRLGIPRSRGNYIFLFLLFSDASFWLAFLLSHCTTSQPVTLLPIYS